LGILCATEDTEPLSPGVTKSRVYMYMIACRRRRRARRLQQQYALTCTEWFHQLRRWNPPLMRSSNASMLHVN